MPKCLNCHKAILVITWTAHYFQYCICVMLIFILQDLTTVCCWSIYLPIYLERKIQGKERVNSILGGFRETPKFPPLVGHPNLPIRKTLRRVLGLLTEWFWKERVRVFSFKATNLHWGQKRSDKFFDEIESTDDYPIQDKKHLRTRRNLNWNPLIYQVGY